MDNFLLLYENKSDVKKNFGENMLAKMPQKTVKSPFKNKLTIISVVLLMGLGVSAAYFTVPFLQAPLPTPQNLIGNTTNTTVLPVSHTGVSAVQTPQVTTNPTNTTTASANTTKIKTPNTTNNNQDTGTSSNISKTSTTTKTTSKTTPSKTNKITTTNST